MKTDYCRYFRAPIHFETCHANINYKELAGTGTGWLARLPCGGESPLRKDPVQCSSKSCFSPEELKEQRETMEKRLTATNQAYSQIKLIAGKQKGISGFIICPLCGNELNYSVARANGHIWAQCKTDGCLRWMQ